MALIDKASLLMVPSTYEAGTLYNVLPSGNRAPDSTDQNSGYDQTRADFDFDRGSNAAATRVNEDGLIEKYRENLVTESNNFSDSDWTKVNCTPTSGEPDKDGGTNAWKLTASTSGTSQIKQTHGTGGIITHSIYAKAGSVDVLKFWVGLAAEFNLTTGATSYSQSKMTDVGNGWWRCEVYLPYTIINPFFSATTAGDYIYIQNAQADAGTIATDYLDSGATTAKAGVLIDLPRINYDANGENGALLLEPSRANGNANSEYFSGTGFGIVAATATPNVTTSPEGVDNATSLIGSTSSAEHIIYTTGSSTYNGDTTISIFAKSNGYDYFVLGAGAQSANKPVLFNIANGTKVGNFTGWSSYSAPIDSDIEDYGNGWYRLSVTFAATSGVNTNMFFGSMPTDSVASGTTIQNGTDGSYIFGAMIEAGSYSTSYIPNHGTSGGVTRAADSCSVTGASDVIGQTEGTLFVEFKYNSVKDHYWAVATLMGSNTSELIELYGGPNSNVLAFAMNDNSVNQFIKQTPLSFGTHKVAIAYAENNTIAYIDGSPIGSVDTNCTIPTLTQLAIGKFSYSSSVFFSLGDGINQTLLFKERLTNEELATLTTL